jgi:predicted component of type VI protein secretion system
MANFTLKPGVVVFITRDVVDYLEFSGILAVDGAFREPTAAEYGALFEVIMKSLKDHQVELPQEVDDAVEIIKLMVPFILSLIRRNWSDTPDFV